MIPSTARRRRGAGRLRQKCEELIRSAGGWARTATGRRRTSTPLLHDATGRRLKSTRRLCEAGGLLPEAGGLLRVSAGRHRETTAARRDAGTVRREAGGSRHGAETVILDPLAQRAAGHAEEPGGRPDLAVALREACFDELALEKLQRRVKPAVRQVVRQGRRLDGEKETGR